MLNAVAEVANVEVANIAQAQAIAAAIREPKYQENYLIGASQKEGCVVSTREQQHRNNSELEVQHFGKSHKWISLVHFML
jgi:hypothetical protein